MIRAGGWFRRGAPGPGSRALLAGSLLAVVMVAAVLAGLAIGDYPVPLREIVTVLAGGGDGAARFVVTGLRLPRVAAGVLAGAALGLAGAISQAVTRNPLATPDVLGVTAGASAAAVAVLVGTGGGGPLAGAAAADGFGTGLGVPIAALVGGLVTAAAVHLLAAESRWAGHGRAGQGAGQGGGQGSGLAGFRLVLAGLAVGALATAVTSWLLVRGRVEQVAQATVWLTGSLDGRTWREVAPLAVAVPLVGVVAVLAAPVLDLLRFGDDTALALGVRVRVARTALLAVAAGLAAVATAAAGPVAFIALAAPHLASRAAGPPGPSLVVSGLAGAALLTTADALTRAFLPGGLPVGVVTAALGAPFLLALLVTSSRRLTA